MNMKVTVIPVIVGALGTIPKKLEKRLDELEIRGKLKPFRQQFYYLDTSKNPRDLRRLATNQTLVKSPQLELV